MSRKDNTFPHALMDLKGLNLIASRDTPPGSLISSYMGCVHFLQSGKITIFSIASPSRAYTRAGIDTRVNLQGCHAPVLSEYIHEAMERDQLCAGQG
jgi:hypothetical protein